MDEIQRLFDKFDQISANLNEALVNGDAIAVQSLVEEQCQWLATLPRAKITALHHGKLGEIRKQIETQQALIQQALSVTEFFLSRLHQQTSYSALG